MELDILGQQPGLSNLFTQLCFCYPLPDDVSRTAILEILTKGLERLSASFPWLAGQVVHDSLPEDKRGVYRIKSLDAVPRLVVKDLSEGSQSLTMHDLRRRNFPISMLNENIVAPLKTLAMGSDEVASSSPVFALQATFITGGLLLTFVSQHNVMDATGHGQITYLFSKACRNESFTTEELRTGNMNRLDLIPLLDEAYQPGPELAMQIDKRTLSERASANASTNPPPSSSWAYFTFSVESQIALKAEATKTLLSGFVSTDDTLSAYIWQSIMRARGSRLDQSVQTTFARAVDPRRYLGIPATYTGLVQNMVYETFSIRQLLAEPLGVVAARLRSAVDINTSNIGFNTRALVTHYYRALDRSTIGVTINIDPAVDLMLSSWSKVDCCHLDFGLGLGKPECIRRPGFIPVEGLLYLMPKNLNGEIAVAVCLRDIDMQRLKEDSEFARFLLFGSVMDEEMWECFSDMEQRN